MVSPYTISPISDGQYQVRMQLDKLDMSPEQVEKLHENYDAFHTDDADFWKICNLSGNVLCYRSETLFPYPDKINSKKKKVLIVLGNPTTHSVANGMFFYSMSEGKKRGEKTHSFWERLEKAGLIEKIRCRTLDEEAKTRKWLLQTGMLSEEYLFGLTTFYSFPTTVMGIYKNIEGVRDFFGSAIKKVAQMECMRLNYYIRDYPFVKDALFIFTEKTTYQYANRQGIPNVIKRWPARGAGCSGKTLAKILLDP